MRVKEPFGKRLVRYRHLLKHFVLFRILHRSWIPRTRALKNLHRGETCFVMATGPSVNRLDLNKIEARVKEGAKIVAINSYLSSDLSDRIKPDYFIISDPCYLFLPEKLKKYQEETDKDLDAIREKSGYEFFVPHHWQTKPEFAEFVASKNPHFFNHAENFAAGPNGSDLIRPRYYIAMTSYIGISVALYLGFKKIYLCGFDENRVEDMEIDINNHVIWRECHFYPETEERRRRDMTVETGMTWENFCLNAILCVQSQEKLRKDALRMGASLWNCNPGSYVVGFPKTAEFLREPGSS